MNRLPNPGGDDDTWGTILNDFLEVSLASDGTLNSGIVSDTNVASNANIAESKIANLTTDLAARIDTGVITAKGDLVAGSAANTPANLSVGSNGTILSANSTTMTGLAWVSAGTIANTYTVVTETSSYGATANDEVILVNANSGTVTVTLPTAIASVHGYMIKKIDTSSNFVTVATTASQTIDGASSASIKVPYVNLSVVSDGSNWYII